MDDVVVLGLALPELAAKAVLVVAVVAVALAAQRVLVRVARRVLDASDVPSASIFVNILRACVWALALLTVWKPLTGQDPSALVAALGVASVAVSLGMQDTVSNLVSGLSLMVGKVVRPGDDVAVGSNVGRVTDVTWRSTTVRTRGGNVEVIPNSVLNKTSLTHVTRWNVTLCSVPVLVSPDADLGTVEADVRAAVAEALGDDLDPEFETGVVFQALTAYGTQAELQLHVRDGVALSSAQTRVVCALQGRPWLARPERSEA